MGRGRPSTGVHPVFEPGRSRWAAAQTGDKHARSKPHRAAQQRQARGPKQQLMSLREERNEEEVQALVDYIRVKNFSIINLRKDFGEQVRVLKNLGLSFRELRKLVDARLLLFETISAQNMQEKLKFFLESVGLTEKQLHKVLVRFPRVLEYNIQNTVLQRLDWLQSQGIAKKDLPRIVFQVPTVLELNITTMQSKLDWLCREVGVPEESIAKIIGRQPQLLACKESSMSERLDFLHTCGFSDEDCVKVVSQHPQVLRYPVVSLQKRLDYFKGIGVSTDKLNIMLTRMPSLLSLNIKMNLVPKFDYLVGELGGSVDYVVHNPVYFGLSLQNRIIPRHQFIEIERPDAMRTPFPINWLKCSDLVFVEKVTKASLEDFENFKLHLVSGVEDAQQKAVHAS